MALVQVELPDALVAQAEAGGLLSTEAMERMLTAALQRARDSEEALESLRADIAVGMADLEAGRVKPFDPEEIIRLGRLRSGASG